MQGCSKNKNLEILDDKISKLAEGTQFWQHLRGLRAILECLQAQVTFGKFGGNHPRVNSYIDFEEAFNLYLGYCDSIGQKINPDVKKRFKELLLHPDFGLCVYIVKIKECRFIVLKADDVHLEDFYSQIADNFTDSPDSRIDLNKEKVKAQLYQATTIIRSYRIAQSNTSELGTCTLRLSNVTKTLTHLVLNVVRKDGLAQHATVYQSQCLIDQPLPSSICMPEILLMT